MFENMTMYQALKKAINETPKETAIFYRGRKINYRHFGELIEKTAAFLQYSLQIKENDVVLISQPNIPESLILFYAVNKLGAVANMVHPFTPYNQLVQLYEKSNAKVAFVFEQRVAKEVEKYRQFPYPLYVTRIEDLLPRSYRFFYHWFYNGKIREKLAVEERGFKGFKYLFDQDLKHRDTLTANNSDEHTAVILHSGSTTGDPKDICLSNKSFNSTAEQACDILCMKKEEVVGKAMLAALPNFHGFGLCMTMHAPLCNNFGCVLIPKFRARDVAWSINKAKNVISICGVPRIYEALNSEPKFWKSKYLKNIHVCFSGGDVLHKQVRDDFNSLMRKAGSKCTLFEGYGLSESTSVVCVNTYDHNKDESIGYPLKGVDIKIFENGKYLSSDEQGEILVKAPMNMICYYNDPKLSKETIDQNGYLHTGDIGYLDEDGFLHFKSRIKRVIKVSGVATFPNEVEKLISSVPGVKDVCVVGQEDEIMGHALVAYIVTDFLDTEDFKQTILDTCRKYLIRWSVPKHIVFIEKIPKTMYGKTDYRQLSK